MAFLQGSKLNILLFIVGVVVWVFIYSPLLVYNGYQYYKNRKHVVYQARYAKITLYEVVFMTSKLLYGCFINAAILYLNEASVTIQLLNSINTLLAYLVLYCFVWRFWCIFYEYVWTKYALEHEWKTIINPKHIENESTWYLSHKDTFGNYIWVKWRILVIAILSAIARVFSKIYSNNLSNVFLSQIIASWMYMIPFIILIIIYMKTPTFDDNFYVQREMKYIFVLLCIDYASFYGFRIIAAVMTNHWSKETINIMYSVAFHFIMFAQFSSVMISTAWVNYMVLQIIDADRYNIRNLYMQQNKPINDKGDTNSILSFSTNLVSVNPDKVSLLKMELIEIQPERQSIQDTELEAKDLTQVLSHAVSFKLFMTHLSYELSMENVLSLIEFLQFQKYVCDKIGYEKKENELLCDCLVLPDIVPLSAIVHDDNTDLKNKAYFLYIKYIANGSMYGINIPYSTKNVLDRYMNNFEEWMCNDKIQGEQLMNIFDRCCWDIKRLMNDSYHRFKMTSQYQRLVHNLLFL